MDNFSIREAFLKFYINENHKDPHTLFAEATGMDRQTAKVRAYEELYTSDFIRAVINNPK